MDTSEEILQMRMRRLVSVSCQFETRPNKDFQKFHTSLLLFYFNAVAVNINYDEKLISIWNSKPLTTNPVRLYDLNNAISDTVGYSDLEETLNGCLECGHLQNSVYIKLLSEYRNYLDNDDDFLSA